MRKPSKPIPSGGPNPADFPLGSVESRAAARRLLKELEPLTTIVYLDDEGEPIWEPGVRYAKVVIEAPRPMTLEEWMAKHIAPEGQEWRREQQRRLPELRKKWLERMERCRKSEGNRP